MPKTIGWRLTLSFAAIALVAAIVLGAVLLAILQNYYTGRELDYLRGNARSISMLLGRTLGREPNPQVQSQIAGLAFLSQARLRVFDADGEQLYDSGPPGAVQLGLGLARPDELGTGPHSAAQTARPQRAALSREYYARPAQCNPA